MRRGASIPTTRCPTRPTTTRPPRASTRASPVAATPEVDETVAHVLTTLDGLAAAGVFPPVADTCNFCDFESLCGPFREARAARKADDPRLAAFKRLRVIP